MFFCFITTSEIALYNIMISVFFMLFCLEKLQILGTYEKYILRCKISFHFRKCFYVQRYHKAKAWNFFSALRALHILLMYIYKHFHEITIDYDRYLFYILKNTIVA